VTPIVCYCKGGNRRALAADPLQKMGFRKVISMAEGMQACDTDLGQEVTPSDDPANAA